MDTKTVSCECQGFNKDCGNCHGSGFYQVVNSDNNASNNDNDDNSPKKVKGSNAGGCLALFFAIAVVGHFSKDSPAPRNNPENSGRQNPPVTQPQTPPPPQPYTIPNSSRSPSMPHAPDRTTKTPASATPSSPSSDFNNSQAQGCPTVWKRIEWLDMKVLVNKDGCPIRDDEDGSIIESEDDFQLYYEDGTYTGSIRNGKRHGYGTFRRSNGREIYEGQWKDDKRNGLGTLDMRTAIYEGQWLNNRPHGQGTLTLFHGETYMGKWNNGCLNSGQSGIFAIKEEGGDSNTNFYFHIYEGSKSEVEKHCTPG
jgi:hypothetical protein